MFADDGIIDTTVESGVISWTKEFKQPGYYRVSLRSPNWTSRVVRVYDEDRSGNDQTLPDEAGNLMSAIAADKTVVLSVGRKGLKLDVGGTGDSIITATAEKFYVS